VAICENSPRRSVREFNEQTDVRNVATVGVSKEMHEYRIGSRMTSPLKALCASVIEAGERATARPWFVGRGVGQFETPRIGTGTGGTLAQLTHYGMMGQDAAYIVTAANSAEAMARALIVMEEALERIQHNCSEGRNVLSERSRIALAKANEILGER